MMNRYSELALENLGFWNSQFVNFSHDAPLGTVKGNRQKVGWRSYDIKPYDEDHPLLCKPGNIVLYRSRNGKIVQGYVLKYISGYAILDSIEGKHRKISVRRILEIYRDYFDYFSKFGETSASTEYKTKKLQEIHSILQYREKGDKFAPKSAIFMKIGAFDYDWPVDLGIRKGTEKPLHLPKNEVIRVGYLGGKCFSNDEHTYDELSVPYQFNPYANNKVYFSTWMYKEKIDAIRNNNIGQLNRILEYQGIPKVSKEIFEVLRYDYGEYLKQVRKSKLNFYPVDYGVTGEIAPWYDSDGNLILKGGATQYLTPLNGINLKTIGVVFLRKK